MSGGHITPPMVESLKQMGSSICAELNAKVSMSSGQVRVRLLQVQRMLCQNEDVVEQKPINQLSTQPSIQNQNTDQNLQEPELTV